jgi:acyl-coenzyme A thioesterase PaaI-like protein
MLERTSQPSVSMTQIKSNAERGQILTWWSRLSRLPAGRKIFSLGLGWITPYSGSIGALVEDIKPGYARVSLRDRRRVRNHLHSIHAVALLNLGEIATGLAVLSAIPANMRGIVLDLNASYIKKARGTLIASAEFQLPHTLQDNTACEVEAQLKDSSGETVTLVKATWIIGYRKT